MLSASISLAQRPQETEPPGLTYDRFRVARLLELLVERHRIARVLESPSTGAKACPSVYSLPLALAGCNITLANPCPEAFCHWKRLGVLDRLTPVQVDLKALPFRNQSFDLAWNFATLGREDSLLPSLSEMARVARTVLLVMQNGYNVGYPWHRLLHWVFSIPWNHGQTRYFFPRNVVAEMREVGLTKIEVGLLDQVPWPDPPGFRDVRLHWSQKAAHPEDQIEWNVPAVEYFARKRFPAWMRLLGAIEDLSGSLPLLVRWPVNHLFYVLGFSTRP